MRPKKKKLNDAKRALVKKKEKKRMEKKSSVTYKNGHFHNVHCVNRIVITVLPVPVASFAKLSCN